MRRYRFLPTSLLVRVVEGNARITQRHLQALYHRGLVNRFAFPKVTHNPGEFQYYLDNSSALLLLRDVAGVELSDHDYKEVRRNREKAYANIHDRELSDDMQGRLLFLKHELNTERSLNMPTKKRSRS